MTDNAGGSPPQGGTPKGWWFGMIVGYLFGMLVLGWGPLLSIVPGFIGSVVIYPVFSALFLRKR